MSRQFWRRDCAQRKPQLKRKTGAWKQTWIFITYPMGLIPCFCRKSCWVCFGNESDDRSAQWIRPCRCRGTTKWVHHSCLMRWVDEKQKGHSFTKVTCPQCNTEYVIVFPPFGKFSCELKKVKLFYVSQPKKMREISRATFLALIVSWALAKIVIWKVDWFHFALFN